jgi:hypothetical protein
MSVAQASFFFSFYPNEINDYTFFELPLLPQSFIKTLKARERNTVSLENKAKQRQAERAK